MDIIRAMTEYFAQLKQAIQKKRRVITALACFVVFLTTYALILPAITLDKNSASDKSGISLGTQQSQENNEAVQPASDPDAVTNDTVNDDPNDDSASDQMQEKTVSDKTAGQGSEDKTAVPGISSDTESEDKAAVGNGSENKSTTDANNNKTEDKEKSAAAAAQNLEFKGNDYTITVKCDEKANLPEGTKLKVKEIRKDSKDTAEQTLYKGYYKKATKAVRDEAGNKKKELKFARFFDISFETKDGKEIEPSTKVNVKIEYDKAVDMKEVDDIKAVHFEEKLGVVKTELIKADATVKNEKMTKAGFDAKKFSVYGLVGSERTLETSVLTAEGKTYKITVTYDDAAGIPDGAELSAKEIAKGSDDYNKYLKKSAKELKINNEKDISSARFFNIEITKDGEKIEPDAAVKIKIKYDNAIDTDLYTNIVHFAKKGTEVITDVDVSKSGKTILYEQDSFSVTGTIQTSQPTNGGHYMLIVEYQGKHYMVNNDGTLSEITYGKDAAGIDDNTKVAVEYPMLWTYYYEYGGHLRFASEASGFNSDNTASGYYYKYIDPNSASGLREEHKDGNGNNLLGDTVINYHDKSIGNAGYNKYIGVSEEGGTLHIVGNASSDKAAKIELATPSSVLPSDPLRHSVNHIDIGIDGTAEVTVPLAYGEYTYTDDNGIRQTITVSQGNTRDVTLHAGKDDITVTSDDMKKAEIKAYKKSDYDRYKDNPEELARHELNDAFYITGYSANNTTDFSEVQVRVEGSFKVAAGIDDANWGYFWDQGYQNWVKQQRLNNKVEYTVSLNKTVTLPVKIDGHQLYDQDGTPMTVTVTIPLKDSFNYWDNNKGSGGKWNECPPVQWDEANWQSGDVAFHGMSGMDFRLDGGHVQVQADMVAINITKYIEDTNGNPIKVGSAVTNKFQVYRDKNGDPDSVKELGSENVNYDDYSFLHEKEIKINSGSDQNILHDYDVTPGMYYVREDPASVRQNETITDTTGQQWKYKGTEIKTEYVWRGGADIGMDDKDRLEKVHTSEYTGKDSDTYNAIPDVLGKYTVDGNPTAVDDHGNSHNLYNGFLEFYVINKYEKVQGEIPEPSQDTMNIQLEKKWNDNGNTDEPDGNASVPFTLHQVKKTTPTGSGSGSSDGIPVVLYDTNGTSVLASTHANVGDNLSLLFATTGNDTRGAVIEVYNQRSDWSQTAPTWKHYTYIQVCGNVIINPLNYTVNESDVVGGKISFRIGSNNNTLSGNFANAPTWFGATGNGGSSTTTTTDVDPEGSGYPKTITLSNTTGWSQLIQNLPTKETIPAENKTIEYSYYLEEGTPTGSAAEYTSHEYKVYADENHNTEEEKNASDQNNAITGSATTKYVEITNKKSRLTVKKEWLGEAETDAYPSVKFKLYQGTKNGTDVNAGEEYTADTNLEKDSNGCYTISSDNNWKVEFNNLPATKEVNGETVNVGYYVQEVNPNDGTHWFGKANITYSGSTGNSGTSPQSGGVVGNNGTLTIINKLPTYDQITIIKKWYENNNGSWNDVSGDAFKTDDYAFGFIVQRQVVELDDNDQETGTVIADYADYGNEIIVKQNDVVLNDNEFNVECQGSIWQYRIQGSGDLSRHENDLVKTGYYEKEDGTKVWAGFKYRFMETNAYELSSVKEGGTVKPKSDWKTLPWNPKYENSGNSTTISNYPIGEIDVTKTWENDDPDQPIGSKVYFKVYRGDDDITSDIIAHPANYGLYSNQVYSDDNNEHDSVVLTYNGKAWDTIRVQGLQILTENSSQYEYKVKEIGYSDKNNNNYWDVSAFLQSYKIDNGESVDPSNSGASQGISAAAPFKTITIENRHIKTETDFEFTKVWQDYTGEGIGWKAPIEITLHQTFKETGTTTGKEATFTIKPYQTSEGETVTKKFTFDGEEYEWDMKVSHEGSYYTFKIEHLPFKDGEDVLSYYVTEEAVDGYLRSYAFATDNGLEIKTSIDNQAQNAKAKAEEMGMTLEEYGKYTFEYNSGNDFDK